MDKARISKLENVESLEDLMKISSEKPVILFKHSSACSISRNVFNEIKGTDADISVIVVQEARDVSNAVSEITGIRHESPQALIIKDGVCVYHASHYDISETDILKNI